MPCWKAHQSVGGHIDVLKMMLEQSLQGKSKYKCKKNLKKNEKKTMKVGHCERGNWEMDLAYDFCMELWKNARENVVWNANVCRDCRTCVSCGGIFVFCFVFVR